MRRVFCVFFFFVLEGLNPKFTTVLSVKSTRLRLFR